MGELDRLTSLLLIVESLVAEVQVGVRSTIISVSESETDDAVSQIVFVWKVG